MNTSFIGEIGPNIRQSIDVLVVGGGMITHDQILPSLYHLQRLGVVRRIVICGRRSAPLRRLAQDSLLAEAFPGQAFEAIPPLETPPDEVNDRLYQQAIAALEPQQLVIVAVPDYLHAEVIHAALEHNQHVLCVKPLVPTYREARAIDQAAKERGLLVTVEYHKRFDRRSLEARLQYRRGRFGQFRIGEAKMIEPYYYRHSNFQNWFTYDKADPFTYVGCHYVDLVYFITGLRPVEVSVRGIQDAFPNEKVGFLWSHGRVVWENGAILSVINGLGYPDQAAGTNDQGLVMYCEGRGAAALIRHDDHFRGASYAYLDDAGGSKFRFINPDYFRLVPWGGRGLKPVGYGYESIAATVATAIQVNQAGANLSESQSLEARRNLLRQVDEEGILATPANSYINELVYEAARVSIFRQGRPVEIRYDHEPSIEPL